MLNSLVLKRFNLAQFKQQETSTSFSIAIEESHFLFHQLFNMSFQTLDSITERISKSFTDFFYCKLFSTYMMDSRTSSDDKLFSFQFAFEDLIETIGSKCEQKAHDWLPHSNGSEGKGDPEVAFSMLDSILKGSLDRLKLMRESKSVPHVDSIRNLSLEGKLGVALFLRNKMIHKGVIPDIITHNYLINGLCKVGAFEKAEWLVKDMSYWGLSPNCVTYNTLMKGYAFKDIDKALTLFSTMGSSVNKVTRNVVSYNIMIHALCKKGLVEEAGVFLRRCSDENGPRNLLASTMLMDNYFKRGDTSLALKHWGEICEVSKEVDVVAYNVIVHGSDKSWGVIVAYKYVNQMFKIGLYPDNFTYNTLIRGLCKAKWIDEACYLFKVMSKMGVSPDQVTHNILIQGLCNVGNMVKAHKLLTCMLKNSIVPAPKIWNIIINGYGKLGDKQNALRMKDQMLKYGVSANVFTYNALILMFIQSGEIVEARSQMKEMLKNGHVPDTVTYNLLVRGESEFGHLYSAKEVYDDMLERGCNPDIVTYTELIKGYCYRGKVKEAERVFNDMLTRDSILAIDHVPFHILMKNYFKMGDFDSVYRVYRKWLRLDKVE